MPAASTSLALPHLELVPEPALLLPLVVETPESSEPIEELVDRDVDNGCEGLPPSKLASSEVSGRLERRKRLKERSCLLDDGEVMNDRECGRRLDSRSDDVRDRCCLGLMHPAMTASDMDRFGDEKRLLKPRRLTGERMARSVMDARMIEASKSESAEGNDDERGRGRRVADRRLCSLEAVELSDVMGGRGGGSAPPTSSLVRSRRTAVATRTLVSLSQPDEVSQATHLENPTRIQTWAGGKAVESGEGVTDKASGDESSGTTNEESGN